MNNQDEYVVYEERMGSRFYYKNGKLHREVGPAYTPWKLQYKYIDLGDQELYIKKYQDFVNEPLYSYEVQLSDKTISKRKVRPAEPHYYLEGIQYNKQEFDAIMLDKQLPKSGANKLKVKI
jgi:hypothetical protein